jgi:hypothetical protein
VFSWASSTDKHQNIYNGSRVAKHPRWHPPYHCYPFWHRHTTCTRVRSLADSSPGDRLFTSYCATSYNLL